MTISDTGGGDTSNNSSMLIDNLQQTKGKPLETRLNSQIPQVDGSHVSPMKEEVNSFKSDYGEEDILYSLEEIFPVDIAKLVSRVRTAQRSADHLCTVLLRPVQGQKYSWPEELSQTNSKVFREVQKI